MYTINIQTLYTFNMLCPLNKAKVIFKGSSKNQFYFNGTLSFLKKYLFLLLSYQFCIIYGTSSQKCTGNFRSKAVLLLWIFYVFVLSSVCYVLCASVYMCFVVTCWERADLLALVCGVFCEFVTFPLVSWVRCGT